MKPYGIVLELLCLDLETRGQSPSNNNILLVSKTQYFDRILSKHVADYVWQSRFRPVPQKRSSSAPTIFSAPCHVARRVRSGSRTLWNWKIQADFYFYHLFVLRSFPRASWSSRLTNSLIQGARDAPPHAYPLAVCHLSISLLPADVIFYLKRYSLLTPRYFKLHISKLSVTSADVSRRVEMSAQVKDGCSKTFISLRSSWTIVAIFYLQISLVQKLHQSWFVTAKNILITKQKTQLKIKLITFLIYENKSFSF